MNVFLPPVYGIQELTSENNLIRQIAVPATPRDGQLANFTGGRVQGHVLVSDGFPELLIVPARTRIGGYIDIRAVVVLVGQPRHVARCENLFEHDDSLLWPGRISPAKQEGNRLAWSEAFGEEVCGDLVHV